MTQNVIMNKFIDYDIHNGVTLLRCAVMNILYALDSMEIDSYIFGPDISIHLVMNCMVNSGWNLKHGIWYSPSMRDFVFTDDINLTLELLKNE